MLSEILETFLREVVIVPIKTCYVDFLKVPLKYSVAQKNGAILSHCKYSENSKTVEIGELLQYYMLNTVINFLFKNFIALWHHLAKTQLLCDAQIYLYSVNKRQ